MVNMVAFRDVSITTDEHALWYSFDIYVRSYRDLQRQLWRVNTLSNHFFVIKRIALQFRYKSGEGGI